MSIGGAFAITGVVLLFGALLCAAVSDLSYSVANARRVAWIGFLLAPLGGLSLIAAAWAEVLT